MPNVRTPGQKLIPIPVSEEFEAAINNNYRRCGCSSRAEFIRKAVYEYLKKYNIEIDEKYILAPDRSGKGGSTKYPAHRHQNLALNETAVKPEKNPAAAEDAINCLPDPKLTPSVKEAAEKVKAHSKQIIEKRKSKT